MDERIEDGLTPGDAEPESSVKNDFSLLEDFEVTLKISQDVGLTAGASSEETDSREELEQQESACPPAAETSGTEKWEVGAQCQAVWSEDGLVYPATVVSVDGDRCRVRFTGYGNEEDVDLSALQSPKSGLQTQSENSQDWKPGSRCRAVYSEDGLVYPAVVLWVKGQRCRVRFRDYNNEEDQDVSGLLNPDEVHGPSRTAHKASGWKSSLTSSNFEGRRKRREESQGGRGGERRSTQQNSSWVKEKSSSQSKVDRGGDVKENQQRDGAEEPTNRSSSLFPPFPPPQLDSADPLAFIPPPPPPVWMFGGKEPSTSASMEPTSSMLMLWYLCGFHTGSYMAQHLLRSTSKD